MEGQSWKYLDIVELRQSRLIQNIFFSPHINLKDYFRSGTANENVTTC